MRVSRVENNKINKVSFGYNQKLNKTLTNLLKDEPTELNNHLLGLVNRCNNIEDTITIKTTKAKPDEMGLYDEETESFLQLFFDLKLAIADQIEKKFPNLKFTKREVAHYKHAGISDSSVWKGDVADELKMNETSVDGGVVFVNPEKQAQKEQNNDIISEHMPTSESPVGFKSLGGMEGLKESFFDKIIFPIKNPKMAALDKLEYGKDFPRATLLVGPPGCGKTFAAEAVAREAEVPFYSLKVGQQGSTYVNGASLNFTKAVDSVANRAKEIGKPCILFLDELEGLVPTRSQHGSENGANELVGTFLDLINNARSRGVIVIAATNKHKLVDPAILSRFDNQEYVGLPDKETRIKILQKALENRSKASSLLNSKEDLAEVAEKFDKFSNRSITDLSNIVSNIARTDGRREIKKEDYFNVIAKNQHQIIKNEAEYMIGAKNSLPPIGFCKNT